MPAGALLQLNAYGAQNQYINGNPQFTYFRGVFRRHTNFAMELIELTFTGPTELSIENPVKITTNIDRNGDLVSSIYFTFYLPDIYSGYNENISFANSQNAGFRFHWVNSIGTNIINSCKLSIGGQTINDLYGEWIRIWHELFSNTNMKNFDEMIGNVPEMFIPESSTESGGIYPTSTLDPKLNIDPEAFTSSQYIINPYLKPPSISGRRITVPLNFWFTQNPGLALPLIAMQYHTVTVDIELKPLLSIYTIIDNRDETSAAFGTRIAPINTVKEQSIQNFISLQSPNSFAYGQNLTAINSPYVGWGLKPSLQVNYVFLDEEERKRFADVSHEYLIEQVIRQDFTGYADSCSLTLKLQNPTKEIVWMAVRDDFAFQNIFLNYTNWPNEISPGSLSYIRNTISETSVSYIKDTGVPKLVDNAYEAYQNNLIPHKFNFKFFQKYPIQSSILLFNGQERFAAQEYSFFQNTQIYQHHHSSYFDGVNVYSFALDPLKYQPSGSCNFSRIHDIKLQLNLSPIQPAKGKFPYSYNIIVYSVNYNIFRVLSGMGGLAFSN